MNRYIATYGTPDDEHLVKIVASTRDEAREEILKCVKRKNLLSLVLDVTFEPDLLGVQQDW